MVRRSEAGGEDEPLDQPEENPEAVITKEPEYMILKQKKVLIALGSAAVFGAERRLLKIVKYLNARESSGLEVHLVLNSSLYILAREVGWIAELLETLKAKRQLIVVPDKLRDLGTSVGLLHLVPLFFTAKVTHAALRGRAIAYGRALFNLRSIVEITSPDIASRIGAGLPVFLLKRISFVCVSPSVQRRFLSEISKRTPGAPLGRFDVTCASIPFFDSFEVATQKVLPKERWIVSASRFISRKNVVLFAHAVKDAIEELDGWKIFLLGQGPEEDRLRAILSDEISSGLVVVGYEARIDEILARSALYVSLIEPDSYPSQSVLEAMAFGNALLLGDVGESARFLDNRSQNGFLSAINQKDVSKNILEATSDFAGLLEMGERSKQLVKERFSADMYISELLERYG